MLRILNPRRLLAVPQFAALRHDDYRLTWSASMLSGAALSTFIVATAWMVLEASDSSTWVGVITFTGMLPFLLISPIAGLLGDADRRLFPNEAPLELSFPVGDETPDVLVPDDLLAESSTPLEPREADPLEAFTFVGTPDLLETASGAKVAASESSASVDLTPHTVVERASKPPPGTSEPAPKLDHAAQTVKRTIGQRKPRKERYAFIGHDYETRGRRRQLLEQLAERSEGTAKARLLVAAAEIAEATGDIDAARTAMEDARAADPKDLVILRWWRRDAVARGDWAEVAKLLEDEAELPLSPADREACLALLAEVRLTQLRDPAGAAEAATSSITAVKTSARCY